MPDKIMIIRHAEKPIPGRVKGVRARGDIDEASLSPLGWQRSGALVQFFSAPTNSHVARPDHLFAVRFDKADVNSTRRSNQTLEPLANATGLSINLAFGEQQGVKMVAQAMTLAGTVLIAWSHGNIPKIAAAIGGDLVKNLEWPDKRFDLVWIFDLKHKLPKFHQLPQLLLAGDSEEIALPTRKAG